MVYDTPLHLRALRDFVLKDSRIENIAIAPPSPEEMERARSIRDRIKDFGSRFNRRYFHHPDGSIRSAPYVASSEAQKVSQLPANYPKPVQEPEFVSAAS